MSTNKISVLWDSIVRNTAWLVCRVLPVKKNKIVISSYYGRGYGDNPKYIVEELLFRDADVEIVWIVKNDKERETLPEGVKSCRFASVKAIYHLATAKIWIDNSRKTFKYKKKSQKYMQTWHGFALKRIEKDVEDKLDAIYVKDAKHDSANVDVVVSDSSFMTGIYKNSFWYDGEVAEWGSPRNDRIINPDDRTINKVRDYFGISPDTKVVLYAPTFRANKSTEPYSIDYHRLCDACEKRFGSKFVVFVRLHPNIVNKCSSLSFDSKVINATLYPDMQELMAFADIVISDYSSLMFDFSLMMKPCFQYATDIEEYKGDRNFYFQIDSLPFDLCVDNDQLENAVLNFDDTVYKERLSAFFDSVGMIRDGRGSERCVNWILEKISQ